MFKVQVMSKVPVMSAVPPKGCLWRVGDEVRFTNENGVSFGPHYVQGFTLPGNEVGRRTIYLDYDCYWFPVLPSSLTHWCGKELRAIRLEPGLPV